MGGACNTHGNEENACNVLIGKPEEKKQFGRCRNRFEDVREIVLQGIGDIHIRKNILSWPRFEPNTSLKNFCR
jgi:hypothetical protein